MRFRLPHSPILLAAFLVAALLPVVLTAQTFDLETARVQISEIDSAWHFHLGDDPQWSQVNIDDSTWPVLKPMNNWAKQGYPNSTELAWFRFHLRVPGNTTQLVLQLPAIAKSFQLFCDGRMIAQVGTLPPDKPKDVEEAARVFTLPIEASPAPEDIVIAMRLWQDPTMIGTRAHRLPDHVYIGSPEAVLNQFSTTKASNLLAQGSTYSIDIVVLIVGAATVLLFWLTRERFYLWFACYLLLTASFLPIDLASAHQAWSYHLRTYLEILLDVSSGIAWILFIVEAIRPGKWKLTIVPIALAITSSTAVSLVLAQLIPIKWGDITYCVAQIGVEVILAAYLIRGWRNGNLYAKLLFFPFAVNGSFAIVANLGYALNDLNLAPSFNMQPNSVSLLSEPFDVSLTQFGTVITLLGMLAVLVYRFARTNREEQRLTAALKAAHDIQQRLVPVDVPVLGGLLTQVAYRAAEEVGGDFCQILPRPDGSVFVAIGDVSGKGLQAAMFGAVAVGALRSMADENVCPAAALERLNTVLLRTENFGFVTCLCLVLSADGKIAIANAGHLSPYLDGVEIQLEAGLPLGILSSVRYAETSLLLPEKARLTLLSDGVVEARSRSGELFGFDRTCECSQLAATEIADRAHRFGQEDDITVITLDWQTQAFAAA